MAQTITKLEPHRRNPDLVNLHVNGEFHSAVAFAALNELQLGTGDELTGDQLAGLLAADARWKAKQAALSLLSVRSRARGELVDRLRRKGFSDEAAEYAVGEMDRLGFVDDAAFAESWVRDRLRLRPRGTQALVYELGRKHVPPDVARPAVGRVMDAAQVTDDALCMEAAERWVRTRAPGAVEGQAGGADEAGRAGEARGAGHETRASQEGRASREGRVHDAAEDARRRERRLTSFLARRGYSHASIRAAVSAVLKDGK